MKFLPTVVAIALSHWAHAQCASFVDNFESASLVPTWTTVSQNPTINNVQPAMGLYALQISGGSNAHMQGISTSITAVQPNSLSWYIKPTGTLQSNYLLAGDNTLSASKNMVFCYWRGSTQEIVFTGATAATSYSSAATPNVWHLIELKNISWTAKTFDIYIDGSLKQTGFAFRNTTVNNLSKFQLYNYDAGSVGNWDHIMLGSSSNVISNATASNATSVAGTTTDTHTQGAGQTILYATSACNLIASVQSSTNLGSTAASVHVQNTIPTYNSQPYVKRWYEITPTTQGNATVTFYFTQNDFTTYNTYATANGWPLLPQNASDAQGKANLRITKNSTGLGQNPVVLAPSSVTWNATKSYWEVVVSTPSFSQFRFHSANPQNSALPVSLVSFDGRALQKQNLLVWKTVTELNNQLFEIEKSVDGKSFETIGQVISKASNGTSNFELSYQFTDDNPSIGHNYYRLKQVDLDNKVTYSQQIDIIRSENSVPVHIYPNPVKNILFADIESASPAKMQIQLIDVTGKIIYQTTETLTVGLNQFQLPTHQLADGIYQFQVAQQDNIIYRQQWIKQAN